ncbi:MAG: hypothetical protein ACXWM7_03550, partial [Parachlamydiaceae bacterium]
DIPMSSMRIRETLNQIMLMNALLCATLTRHRNVELHFSRFLANTFIYAPENSVPTQIVSMPESILKFKDQHLL